MKKILIASYSLGFGGIETSLINLLKNFDLKKYKVTLVLEKKEGVYLNDVPKEVEIKEYKVSTSNNFVIRKIKNLINRIKWIIKNYNKYDASISYATYSGPCGFVARTASKNKILFVHNDYYQIYLKDERQTKEFFDKLKICKYNHVVFVSNESRESIEKLYPVIKAKTINNLIDHKKILDLSKEIEVEKKENKKTFLFVGRLDEHQKRVSRIIEVANKFKDKKNLEFWILGDGEQRPTYEKMIKKYKLKNIKLLGAKKNPYPYIKVCDAILLTSDYEGFPVVYNEAIILNKPIITTINVSDESINIQDGFGMLCNKDVKSICQAILKFINENHNNSKRLDFKKLNKKRIDMIMELLEEENG